MIAATNAAAQSDPPKLTVAAGSGVQLVPGSQSQPNDNRVQFLDSEGYANFQQENERNRAELRRRLADPQQRERIRAERIEQARAERPDLARLLRLDARTTEKLLGVLADQRIAGEVRPWPALPSFDPRGGQNPMLVPAQEYTQRMREIGAVVDGNALDALVAYEQSSRERQEVERLNTALPSDGKLSFEQKDALVAVLRAAEQRKQEQAPLEVPMRLASHTSMLALFNLPPEQLQRRVRLDNIMENEAGALRMEAYHRELRARVVPLLRPQQLEAFAAQLQEKVNQLRTWTQARRRELGIAPDAPLGELPASSPPPALTDNLQLELQLDINDTKLEKTLTSVRGAPVSFEAPEGLSIQARPFLVDKDRLIVELKFYEPSSGERRMVGYTWRLTRLTNPRQLSNHDDSDGHALVMGRKGYAVLWSCTATYEWP
jgi:hypothetical protein